MTVNTFKEINRYRVKTDKERGCSTCCHSIVVAYAIDNNLPIKVGFKWKCGRLGYSRKFLVDKDSYCDSFEETVTHVMPMELTPDTRFTWRRCE